MLPATAPPSREAGCAGQLHEISHQPPLNLNHGICLLPLSHSHTHTHTNLTRSTRQQVDTSRNGVPAGAGAHDMQCRLASHVTYCSTYTTREPSTAPDCTGSNAKEHARWDLTSETAHHITSISRPLCCGHVMPTILRTYEELCHALFPEVKSTNIEIENRHAVDASLSLPQRSLVSNQVERVSYWLPGYTHSCMIDSRAAPLNPSRRASWCTHKLSSEVSQPATPAAHHRSPCEMRPTPRRSGRGL